MTKDRYGRTVAKDYIYEHNLSQSLDREGYVWVYRKYCKMDICDSWYRDEDQARELKKGLWRDRHSMPPWQWRKAEEIKMKWNYMLTLGR